MSLPENHNRQLAEKIINKDIWWDILSKLIDVLKINLFIVDTRGEILLPPEEGRYGGKLLVDQTLALNILQNNTNVLIKEFNHNGSFLESTHRFGIKSFALPISIMENNKPLIIAYLIVSPVILNKRISFEDIAITINNKKIQNNDDNELINIFNEIRIVSHLMINSILDLLTEIIRNNVELSLKNLTNKNSTSTKTNSEINSLAQEIFQTVQQDELLVTFLDLALKMTNAECGSVMIIDEQKNLNIKVSRGLNKLNINDSNLKLGEGIAGIAAMENKTFILKGQKTSNNRIHQLLKRPDIKQSIVMPIMSTKQGIIGVLNLHTKTSQSHEIDNNLENLKYLRQLLSTAI